MESAVLTCLHAFCSGDTVANSAHQADGDQLSRAERRQCRKTVFATHWRYVAMKNGRITRRRRRSWRTLTVIQAGPLGWKSRKGQEVDTGGHTVKGKTSEKDKS